MKTRLILFVLYALCIYGFMQAACLGEGSSGSKGKGVQCDQSSECQYDLYCSRSTDACRSCDYRDI